MPVDHPRYLSLSYNGCSIIVRIAVTIGVINISDTAVIFVLVKFGLEMGRERQRVYLGVA